MQILINKRWLWCGGGGYLEYTGQCNQGYYTTSTSTLSLLPSDGLAPHLPHKYLEQTLSFKRNDWKRGRMPVWCKTWFPFICKYENLITWLNFYKLETREIPPILMNDWRDNYYYILEMPSHVKAICLTVRTLHCCVQSWDIFHCVTLLLSLPCPANIRGKLKIFQN